MGAEYHAEEMDVVEMEKYNQFTLSCYREVGAIEREMKRNTQRIGICERSRGGFISAPLE